MWRKVLGVVVAAVLGVIALPGPAADAGGDAVRAPVVVVGVAGLTWDDVSAERTPALWRLLDQGAAAGAATVRVGDGRACPADGWLSLSAGRPSTAPRTRTGDCAPPPAVTPDGRVAGWRRLADAQRDSEFSPHLGTLGAAFGAHGRCATAIGPGAALALADRDGVARRYYSNTIADDAFACPVTIVDGGRPAAGGDQIVEQVLDRIPVGTTMLVMGISGPAGGRPELGATILVGPRKDPRLLTAASTRWDGVVRLLDLPGTLLQAVGIADPADFTGAPIAIAGARPSGTTETVRTLAGITTTDQVLRRVAAVLLSGAGGVQVLLCVLALAVRRRLRSPTARDRWRRRFRDTMLVLAAMPVSAYLVALTLWWRTPRPYLALWLYLLSCAFVIAMAAARMRWRRPRIFARSAESDGIDPQAPGDKIWRTAGALSLLTFGVLMIDGVTGAALPRRSPLGPSVLYGGRFYGFGNTTFSILTVATLVLAGAVAAEILRSTHHPPSTDTPSNPARRPPSTDASLTFRNRRRAAVCAVAAIGLSAVAVDVWPGWGADVGGGIALVPGVAFLALRVAGARVTPPRLALAGLAGIAAVAAVAVADWSRAPTDRSHAGRFVQDVIDGNAWELLSRKAGYALGSLGAGPTIWIIGAALVIAVGYVLRARPACPPWLDAAARQWPTLRPTLYAIGLSGAIGAVINDYGIRIVLLMLATLLPLVALTCAAVAAPGRTRQDHLR
jgi:hypothetical protein